MFMSRLFMLTVLTMLANQAIVLAEGCPCTCKPAGSSPTPGSYVWDSETSTPYASGSPSHNDPEGAWMYGSWNKSGTSSYAFIIGSAYEYGWGSATSSLTISAATTKGDKTVKYKFSGAAADAPGALFTSRFSGSGSVEATGSVSGNTGSSSANGSSQGSGSADGQPCTGEPDLDFTIGVTNVGGNAQYNTSKEASLGVTIGKEEAGVNLSGGSEVSGNWSYTATNCWNVTFSREGCMGSGATNIQMTLSHQVSAATSVVGDGSLFWPAYAHAEITSSASLDGSLDNLRRCN